MAPRRRAPSRPEAALVAVDSHSGPFFAFGIRIDPWPPSRHVHAVHEFIYCASGRGHQLCPDGACERFRGGDLFCFPAGAAHNSRCFPGEGFFAYVLHCDDSLFDAQHPADADAARALRLIIDTAARDPRLPCSDRAGKAIERCLKQIVDEHQARRPGFRSLMKAHFTVMLITLLRELPHGPPRREASPAVMMDDLRDYIEHNYMYPLTVDDLLAHCPASRSHFHALFKRHFGRTATEAINAIRIDRACAALQAGEGSMSDIAFACGFASQSRFNAVFRSLRGCSPRQWRARQLQDS